MNPSKKWNLRFALISLGLISWLGGVYASAQEKKEPEQSGSRGTMVIRGATIIDGSGGPAFGPADIFVQGNKIVRIAGTDAVTREEEKAQAAGTKPKPPDRVIDGKGMYAMPGIVDLHSHINFNKDVPAEYIYKLYLGHGVTTIRTFNYGDGDPKRMVEEKKKIAVNQVIAPRMYVYPFWRGTDARLSNAEGAKQIVDEWHALGVDGIKILGKPGLWPDVFKAIADEARKNGMGVAVHIGQDGVYPMNAVRIAADGASTIEHHYGYSESSFTNQTIQDLPPDYNYSNEADRFLETGRVWLQADLNRLHGEVINSLLEAMHNSGFVMDPTFSIYEANRDVTRAENLPWHAEYTHPAVMKSFLPNPSHHASYFFEWTSDKEADWARAYRIWMDFVNDYKNQGGMVAVGSDSGFLFSIWGFGTIRELELLEEAGFSPLETIHAATENGAKALRNAELGLIRPGYLADMVLLSENPLADVKILYGSGVTRAGKDGKLTQEHCVKYTIRDGVVFDSQALLADVREIVAKAKQSAASSKN